ncbi:hypothetical protein [Prosthecobacter sp.]|uniref:hypothetical protein n=1 Tax=Prosthecobacter sp. TaxID=1965333 RepID=UPI003782E15C
MNPPALQQQIDFDIARLASDFPPVWRHPHKQAVYDLVLSEGEAPGGTLRYTRWELAPLPDEAPLHACDFKAETGFFTYRDSAPGIWHLNFADPRLFAAYGSPLMAQDEWQVLEHPVLGSLREALLHDQQPALTRENGISTPVLISNVPRQCSLDLSGAAALKGVALSWWQILVSPFWSGVKTNPLYGNAFQHASTAEVLRTITVLNRSSNIIAISAPTGTGAYSRRQITDILQTAGSGFMAAVLESTRQNVSSDQVTIHTGWWGCGAFGGNRTLMALLQMLAAKMAGIAHLTFHIGPDRDLFHFDEARAFLDLVTNNDRLTHLPSILDEIEKLHFSWGQSDGN